MEYCLKCAMWRQYRSSAKDTDDYLINIFKYSIDSERVSKSNKRVFKYRLYIIMRFELQLCNYILIIVIKSRM